MLARDAGTQARLGRITTTRGEIPTPAFLPVATHGFVRALPIAALAATGAQIVLANAYHLRVRPGAEAIAALGGLHRFMGWEGAILTDSGGFQVTSLAGHRQVTDDGIAFRSHVDGALLFLDPESALDFQVQLGVDIAMVLDECTPHPYTPGQSRAGLDRTLRWAERAVRRGVGPGQALFAITQGGTDPALRREAAHTLSALPFDGYAIGGLGIGEGREALRRTVAAHAPDLPEDRPRYLMGVGPPADIVEAVAAGVDMFDCVIPTRNARNAAAFTWQGLLNLRNARHARDPAPLGPDCRCGTCARHPRGYLHHLVRTADSLAGSLLTAHNLHFYQQLMETIRQAIPAGTLGALRHRLCAAYPDRAPGPRPLPPLRP
ncbi:MAG: tRNA guanosine(34) transglycosylase Tgt [Planctomycetes bacterium]|nr:tRNA guanosine(34) transglycosylase Tgt [Planctomycetota bacterium]